MAGAAGDGARPEFFTLGEECCECQNKCKNELYGSNCKHLTLCLKCGTAKAQEKAACPQCGVQITRLIREYPVFTCHPRARGNRFLGKFPLVDVDGDEDVNSAENKKKRRKFFKKNENKWSIYKSGSKGNQSTSGGQRGKPQNKPWMLEDNTTHAQYKGTPYPPLTASYYMLAFKGSQFEAIPVGPWYNFQKMAQYKQLTTEEAEEEMKRLKKNQEGFSRWIMKGFNKDEASAKPEREMGFHSRVGDDSDEDCKSGQEGEDEDSEEERKKKLRLNKNDVDDNEEEKGNDLSKGVCMNSKRGTITEMGYPWNHLFLPIGEKFLNKPRRPWDLRDGVAWRHHGDGTPGGHLFFTVGLALDSCPTCINGTRFSASVNNISFVMPTISLLQAHYFNISGVFTTDFPDNPPTPFNYTGNTTALNLQSSNGTRLSRIPFNSTVQLVLQDTSMLTIENHPFHLHGFNFFVVGRGFGNYNPNTDPAKFNLVDPPERNTVGVPTGGWTAIRFRADNPGVWLMHCHLEVHTTWGLKMAFLVENGAGPNQSLLPPPKDLPTC